MQEGGRGVLCIGWVVVAGVVLAFWAVPVAATLALFPKGAPSSERRSDDG
jgi:hypothetical protein